MMSSSTTSIELTARLRLTGADARILRESLRRSEMDFIISLYTDGYIGSRALIDLISNLDISFAHRAGAGAAAWIYGTWDHVRQAKESGTISEGLFLELASAVRVKYPDACVT